MTIVMLHEFFDEKRLQETEAKMISMGAPIIKAIWDEGQGVWAALEGCHRLRAAKTLGLTPIIEEIQEWEYESETLVSKFLPNSIPEDPQKTISDILDYGWNVNRRLIDFKNEN